MALTSCPECSHRVSDKAVTCPSCGYPFVPVAAAGPGGKTNTPRRAGATKRRASPVLLAFLLLLAGGGLAFWAAKYPAPSEEEHRVFIAKRYPKLEQDTGLLNFFAAMTGKSVRLKYRTAAYVSWVVLEVDDGKGNTSTQVISTGAFGTVR